MNIERIKQQIQWIIKQIECIKNGECVCNFQETNLTFDEDTRELSSTFVDGSVKTVIIPGGDPVEGTWAKLNELKENEELIPGDTYILTDYQTKYIIEGTDTEDSESLLPVIGTASGYAQFYCINSEILNASNALGTELTIKAIPSSYTGPLTVGQTVTIDAFLIVAMLGFPLELLPQESF